MTSVVVLVAEAVEVVVESEVPVELVVLFVDKLLTNPEAVVVVSVAVLRLPVV